MIVTTRSDELMTDEDLTFGAWVDPSTRYSVTAVMYLEADPNFPSCLIRNRHDRTWWLPWRLFEWPDARRPWPTRWAWAAGTSDVGNGWMLAGDIDIVRLGWDAYEGVVDRWDSVIAVADRVTAETSLRDEVIDRVATYRAGGTAFTELATWADGLVTRPRLPQDVYLSLVEITGHIDQPTDTDALAERVLGFVT